MNQFDQSSATSQSNSSLLQDHSGKYRWLYELPMLKSFFLLFEVWKVLGISIFIVYSITLLIQLISGNGFSSFSSSFLFLLIPSAILFVLSLPAYYIVTKANNGKYTVLFEMDNSGIDHIQVKTAKAKALELLTVFVGRSTNNPTTTAAGLLSASGTSLYSRFSNVKKIHAYPKKHLIKLNGTFFRNQVYVDEENFDFVYNYILQHCPDAERINHE